MVRRGTFSEVASPTRFCAMTLRQQLRGNTRCSHPFERNGANHHLTSVHPLNFRRRSVRVNRRRSVAPDRRSAGGSASTDGVRRADCSCEDETAVTTRPTVCGYKTTVSSGFISRLYVHMPRRQPCRRYAPVPRTVTASSSDLETIATPYIMFGHNHLQPSTGWRLDWGRLDGCA